MELLVRDYSVEPYSVELLVRDYSVELLVRDYSVELLVLERNTVYTVMFE